MSIPVGRGSSRFKHSNDLEGIVSEQDLFPYGVVTLKEILLNGPADNRHPGQLSAVFFGKKPAGLC